MMRENLRRWALVFATMRRKQQSNADMKSELAQGVDHFRRAATLAAQGTSATVGPRVDAAKGRMQPVAGKAKYAASSGWDSALKTLAPLVVAAGQGVRQSGKVQTKANKKAAKKNAKKLQQRANKVLGRKQSSGKASKLAGFALVGTAVGAGAAYLVRKRKAAQWDEYDPSGPAGSATTSSSSAVDDGAFVPMEPGTPAESTTAFVEPSSKVHGDADPASDLNDPTLADATVDQTSSTQHSPKVARMASGKNKD